MKQALVFKPVVGVPGAVRRANAVAHATDGTCSLCGQPITAGAVVNRETGVPVYHLLCTVQAPRGTCDISAGRHRLVLALAEGAAQLRRAALAARCTWRASAPSDASRRSDAVEQRVQS